MDTNACTPRRVRISIDYNKCVGSTMCIQVSPKVFGLSETRQAKVLDAHGDAFEAIKDAAEQCPVSAITLEDEASGERVFP